MENYLVTGGSGFIGRVLVRQLREAGHRVRVLDALIEQVHESRRDAAGEDPDLMVADIRDGAALRRAIADIDGVFHLAAEVGVGQSMYEITRYVGANDLGTAALLEALIGQPVRRIVVASSMSVYGEGLYRGPDGRVHQDVRRRPEDLEAGRWEPRSSDGAVLEPIPTDESKPVDLASIYALTKYAQERAVLIFGAAYDVEAVALRLFNVFGPGQALSNPYTGVLANFGSRLANGERPIVFEDGRQKRDFVHVEDVARAFRLAMSKPEAPGQVINIGSGQSYAIADVAATLAATLGVPDIRPEIVGKKRSGDIRNCFADISRARDILGFAPERRLENELGDLARWIAGSAFVDRGAEMRRHLEQRGLVS